MGEDVINAFKQWRKPKKLTSNRTRWSVIKLQTEYKVFGCIYIYITTKLNWRLHIENLINKARKQLNFLKIVRTQSGHKNVITFMNIFSETESDIWSGGIFFRTNHTPKEACKASIVKQLN